MSGPSDPDLRAAEYVLGVATAPEAAAVQRDLRTDPALAAAVAAWERRLAPLTELTVPEAPPPGLWDTIKARLGAPPRPVAAPAASWRDRLVAWWAAGATVTAAVLGVLLLATPWPGPAPLMAVMVMDRTQAAWSAVVARDGAIRLAASSPVGGGAEQPVPPGRVMQLWALPPGATAPTSLALLDRNQRNATVSAPAVRPVPGMLIEITLEPAGGSPVGRPTGPVLFIGRLSQPGPDT